MFSGLAAAVGVGSGALATAGAVAGSIIGTNKIGDHEKEYVLAVYEPSGGGNKNMRFIEGNGLEKNSFSDSLGATFSTEGKTVAYGNNIWVAIGNTPIDAQGMMYSYDGKLWQYCEGVHFNSDNDGSGVVYGSKQKLWVATADSSTTSDALGTILTSPDGIAWSKISSGGFTEKGVGVGYGKGRYIAVGSNGITGNDILKSDDGKIWSECSTPPLSKVTNGVYRGIAYGHDGKWVAVGSDTNPGYNILFSSNNGDTFKKTTGEGFVSDGFAVAYGNGIWVAGGDGGTLVSDNLLWSDTGIKWNQSTTSGGDIPLTNIKSIIYDGKRFIAVGSYAAAGKIFISPDGKHWEDIGGLVTSMDGINGIAYKP